MGPALHGNSPTWDQPCMATVQHGTSPAWQQSNMGPALHSTTPTWDQPRTEPFKMRAAPPSTTQNDTRPRWKL
eukprot:361736-Chlamydomonas_euryale.AAC.3